MAKTSLNIFAKSPILGTVKTRMCPPLSQAQCLHLHQILVNHTLRLLQPLSSSEVEIVVCFTGTLNQALDYADRLAVPNSFLIDIQLGKDLGERLQNTLTTRMKAGYSEVIFIGTDCPRLSLETVQNAIKSLGHQDVVIGPANDGGYYLIGFSSYIPAILQGIHWGTPEVYKETVNRLMLQSVQWESIQLQSDLDTFEDLKELQQCPEGTCSFDEFTHQELWKALDQIIREVLSPPRGH